MAQHQESRRSSSSPSLASKGPLHNFAMPNSLKWGNQRFLRCMKQNPNSNQFRSSAARNGMTHNRQSPPSPVAPQNSAAQNPPSNEIETVREKIMVDLRDAADRMKISMLEDEDKDKPKDKAMEEKLPNSDKPWNLRLRRSACKAPQVNGSGSVTGGGGGGGEKEGNFSLASPVRRQDNRLRGVGGGSGSVAENKVERTKFSINLSKKEIESDFLAMTGAKPQRRPRKRPRVVQRKIDEVVPGLWLSEVTPETYKVIEEPRKGQQ